MRTSIPRRVTLTVGWRGLVVERDPAGMRVKVVLPESGEEWWQSVRPGKGHLIAQDGSALYEEMAATLLIDALSLASVAAHDEAFLIAVDVDPSTAPEVRALLPSAFEATQWVTAYQRHLGGAPVAIETVAAALSAGGDRRSLAAYRHRGQHVAT